MRSLLPILVFALGSTVTAAIPRAIPYQGILTDAAGNAKPDSTYSVTFKLYAAETGGSAVWSESREVESRSGLFAVMLGEGEALPADFSQTYWLGVTVGGGAEMAPRVKLGSAAYALHAQKADTAGYAISANSTANAAVAASAVMADSAKAVRAGGIGANTIDSAQIKDGGIAGADINPGATLNIASLGIGGPVTSSYGLQIKGRDKDISLTDSAGGAVRSLHIGIGNNVFGTSKPGVYINTQAESGTDAGYAFAVQDTSRLTITADGNIGIGTS